MPAAAKVIELIGVSNVGWEDAVAQVAIDEAKKHT
jgi:flavin-binding protein dodecin